MMFTTVHLHPVEERLSRNEGGGVFDLGGHLSHTLYRMFQNVFMFSSFDLLFCCSLATFHFCMLFVGTDLIFANFSWIIVPM